MADVKSRKVLNNWYSHLWGGNDSFLEEINVNNQTDSPSGGSRPDGGGATQRSEMHYSVQSTSPKINEGETRTKIQSRVTALEDWQFLERDILNSMRTSSSSNVGGLLHP